MLKGILNVRAGSVRPGETLTQRHGVGIEGTEESTEHCQKATRDQRLAVAVTATPNSFSLARARRSSSVPGKRLTTSRSSRTPEVFWPSSISAMPFFRCAGASLKLLG